MNMMVRSFSTSGWKSVLGPTVHSQPAVFFEVSCCTTWCASMRPTRLLVMDACGIMLCSCIVLFCTILFSVPYCLPGVQLRGRACYLSLASATCPGPPMQGPGILNVAVGWEICVVCRRGRLHCIISQLAAAVVLLAFFACGCG